METCILLNSRAPVQAEPLPFRSTITAQTVGVLTAHEAINLLAFGQASTGDYTGYDDLQKKWQAGLTRQPSPELLELALKGLIEVGEARTSNTSLLNSMYNGIVQWAHEAVKFHGRPPVEVLEELKRDFLPVIERRRAYRTAERRLVSLLSHGEVTAFATPAQLCDSPGADPGRLEPVGTGCKVELAIWQTPGIGIWPNGDIREAPEPVPRKTTWFGPLFVAIRLPRLEVARFRPSASTVQVTATAGDATRLRKWLIERMRESPEVSPGKKNVRSAAEAAGHRFGVRQFDKAWGRAVEDAPAPTWSAKGRKLKQG